jgi:hypothetical protein
MLNDNTLVENNSFNIMIIEFEPITTEIKTLVDEWEAKLIELSSNIITDRRNSQNRTIKQIIGHLIDSASNNTHRIIHLQYQENPLIFPNYASNGNNDRWIAIQDYQNETWINLIQLWKYSNKHIAHVIANINPEKINNEWVASADETITLREMVTGYLKHLKLHLQEVDELCNTIK